MMDDGAAGAGISFSVVFALLLLLLLLLLFFVDEDPTRGLDPFFVFSTFSLSSSISLADLAWARDDRVEAVRRTVATASRAADRVEDMIENTTPLAEYHLGNL